MTSLIITTFFCQHLAWGVGVAVESLYVQHDDDNSKYVITCSSEQAADLNICVKRSSMWECDSNGDKFVSANGTAEYTRNFNRSDNGNHISCKSYDSRKQAFYSEEIHIRVYYDPYSPPSVTRERSGYICESDFGNPAPIIKLCARSTLNNVNVVCVESENAVTLAKNISQFGGYKSIKTFDDNLLEGQVGKYVFCRTSGRFRRLETIILSATENDYAENYNALSGNKGQWDKWTNIGVVILVAVGIASITAFAIICRKYRSFKNIQDQLGADDLVSETPYAKTRHTEYVPTGSTDHMSSQSSTPIGSQ